MFDFIRKWFTLEVPPNETSDEFFNTLTEDEKPEWARETDSSLPGESFMSKFIVQTAEDYYREMLQDNEILVVDALGDFVQWNSDNGKPTAAFTTLVLDLAEKYTKFHDPKEFNDIGTKMVRKHVDNLIRMSN